MSEGLSNAVQIGMFGALAASTELDNLLARAVGMSSPAIYDDVTQPADTGDNSNFPYLVIGDDIVRDWSTETALGGEAMCTLHIWSRYNGKREAKQIQAAVYNALARAELTTPDHEFIGCEFESDGPVIIDPDGQTYHATSEYRIIIDEPGYGE